MIWDRIGILRLLFQSRAAAGKVSARWVEAAEREPELVGDVIRISGLLALDPRRVVNGVEVPEPIDPIRLARAAGRREMALELLALMNVGAFELRELMEDEHA